MARARHVRVTEDLARRIAAVEQALATYTPGADSAAVVEVPKLELADALLRALRVQKLRFCRPTPVKVTCALRSRRRRRA